jgi:hypothetical protein
MSLGAQRRVRSEEELVHLAELMIANHSNPEWEARRIAALIEAGTACDEGCECERHSERVRQLKAQGRLGTTQSEETRAKIGATLRQMLLDGTWAPGKTLPVDYQKGDIIITMRSPWEVDFAEALDRHGIAWDFEPKRFDLGWTTYLPDFYLPASDTYVEVKGWLREDAATKMASFQKLGHKVVLVTYHPSTRGLVSPVPEGIRVVLGPEVPSFIEELQV